MRPALLLATVSWGFWRSEELPDKILATSIGRPAYDPLIVALQASFIVPEEEDLGYRRWEK